MAGALLYLGLAVVVVAAGELTDEEACALQVASTAVRTKKVLAAEAEKAMREQGIRIILIGASEENEKVVELPEEDMTVDAVPINKQDDWWSDAFEVTVDGLQLTVKRIDDDGGWGQDLRLTARWQIIPVGQSEENEKVVKLPGEGYEAANKPANHQEEKWSDEFEVTIKGNQMTVKRADADGGWGQDLQIKVWGGTPNATEEDAVAVPEAMHPEGSRPAPPLSNFNDLPRIKELDDMLKGYNVFLGDPLNPTTDPGIAYQIFDSNYTAPDRNSNNKVAQPIGIRVDEKFECGSQVQQKSASTQSDWETMLGSSVSLGVSGLFEGIIGSFTGSVSYSNYEAGTVNKGYSLYTAFADCVAYTATIKHGSHPPFSPFFQADLDNLKNSLYDDAFHHLFTTWGTHYQTKANFGARKGSYGYFTSEGKTSMKRDKMSVDVGLNIWAEEVSGSVSADVDNENYQAFKSYMTGSGSGEFSIGPRPVAGKFDMGQVKANPGKVWSELAKICDLMPTGLVKNKCVKAMKTYCSSNIKVWQQKFPSATCSNKTPEGKYFLCGVRNCVECATWSCKVDRQVESDKDWPAIKPCPPGTVEAGMRKYPMAFFVPSQWARVCRSHWDKTCNREFDTSCR